MLGGAPAVAHADVPPPTSWPQTAALQPQIDTTAYSIRFGGADRYQTNLTTNLALRGNGGYPFSTPDPASGWWGVGVCPRSIIVVAGDVFADALTAASLSDPSDRSSQPRLRVEASNDPIFLPAGMLDRPDTAYAPIIITPSARQGATGLGPTARSSAVDFNHGGCSAAKQAIIVGGASSVPSGVAQELVGLGYDEVFRVGGFDRYDTAAQIAAALGVGSGTSATACTDPDTTDGSARMGWYGNAVAEFRTDATTCQLLPRAVVLTDGGQGADALAAGWWTSFWQVPMLLTAPDGSLPAATQAALRALSPDAVIVLGGTGRIPESTVSQATALAGGAAAGRIGGNDRYETSVLMAEKLGGWWPTGHGADFAGSMVCIAASGGDTAWPDALAAGPWCGAASARAAGAPARLLPPVDVPTSLQLDGTVNRAHDAVPVLLVRPGSAASGAATNLVAAAFDPGATWCSSISVAVCTQPGFVAAFGGASGVTASALRAVGDATSGGTYGSAALDASPRLSDAFQSGLDLSPVFGDASGTGQKLCAPRATVGGIRWLVADARSPVTIVDLSRRPPYGPDPDGVTRGSSSIPLCWPVPAGFDSSKVTGLQGVSLSGNRSAPVAGGGGPLTLARPLTVAGAASSSGAPGDTDSVSGGLTTWTFDAAVSGVTVTSKAQVASLNRLTVTVALERGVSQNDPDVVSGAVSVLTNLGTVSGSFAGEGRLVSGTWQLRGRVTWSGGSWNVTSGSGGFRADISTQTGGTNGDDVLVWDADGVVR